jgi:hypothetical protein
LGTRGAGRSGITVRARCPTGSSRSGCASASNCASRTRGPRRTGIALNALRTLRPGGSSDAGRSGASLDPRNPLRPGRALDALLPCCTRDALWTRRSRCTGSTLHALCALRPGCSGIALRPLWSGWSCATRRSSGASRPRASECTG